MVFVIIFLLPIEKHNVTGATPYHAAVSNFTLTVC